MFVHERDAATFSVEAAGQVYKQTHEFVYLGGNVNHYDTLRRTHHSFLTRCIGCRKHNRTDHPISYLDTLVKTGSESIEAILRKRRILFAGFVAYMEDTRLPKCVMFGELVGGAEFSGVQEKNGWGVLWTTSKFSASTPTSR